MKLVLYSHNLSDLTVWHRFAAEWSNIPFHDYKVFSYAFFLVFFYFTNTEFLTLIVVSYRLYESSNFVSISNAAAALDGF